MTHGTDTLPTRRGRLNRWLLALLALLPLMAAAALVDGPNATVYAIARGADGTTYLGGDFTLWGPRTGGLGALATTDGAVDHNFPPVTGKVWAIQSDGAGGWFIGGTFTAVGGLARTNLAQIDSSGAVTAWAPAANSTVYALALSGTTLYAGGGFTAITPAGGSATTRNRLAALTTADTGSLAAWDPNADDTVNALAVSGHTVYAGGGFTTLTGELQSGSPTAYLGRLNALPCSSGIGLTTSPSALWQQLALPCVPATTTVGTTLGANTTGQLDARIYGDAAQNGWLMYGNDLIGNKNLKLAVTDTLTNGVG